MKSKQLFLLAVSILVSMPVVHAAEVPSTSSVASIGNSGDGLRQLYQLEQEKNTRLESQVHDLSVKLRELGDAHAQLESEKGELMEQYLDNSLSHETVLNAADAEVIAMQDGYKAMHQALVQLQQKHTGLDGQLGRMQGLSERILALQEMCRKLKAAHEAKKAAEESLRQGLQQLVPADDSELAGKIQIVGEAITQLEGQKKEKECQLQALEQLASGSGWSALPSRLVTGFVDEMGGALPLAVTATAVAVVQGVQAHRARSQKEQDQTKLRLEIAALQEKIVERQATKSALEGQSEMVAKAKELLKLK